MPFGKSSSEKPLTGDGAMVKNIETEKQLEGLLELMIPYAEKINEGNWGAIFKIKNENIPPELIKLLKDEFNIILDVKVGVIKLLKIYRPGVAEHELSRQQEASEIVPDDPDNYALIPKPIIARDIKLQPKYADTLKERGLKDIKDKVGLMLMDFIPGEDIATLLFKELIKREHPKLRHLKSALQSGQLDFFQLQQEVTQSLGFSLPGGKSRDEGERIHEEWKVNASNQKILDKALQSVGFVPHPAISRKIRATMELLNNNDFVHGDAHHRNFMVVGDIAWSEGAKDPKVYLVDFGSARGINDKKEWQGKRPDDFIVCKHLDQLFAQSATGQSNLEDNIIKELSERGKFLERRLAKDFEIWHQKAKEGNLQLESIFIKMPGSGAEKVEHFVSAIQVLIQDGSLDKKSAYQYIENKMKQVQKSDMPAYNKFNKYINLFK